MACGFDFKTSELSDVNLRARYVLVCDKTQICRHSLCENYLLLVYCDLLRTLYNFVCTFKRESRGISLFHFGVRAFVGMQKSEGGMGGVGGASMHVCSH